MKITFFNVDLHFLGRHSLFSLSIIGPTTNLLKIHAKSNISFLKVCDVIKPGDKHFWAMRWNHASNIAWHLSLDYYIWWTMIFFLHAALWIVVQICLFWVLTLYTFDKLGFIISKGDSDSRFSLNCWWVQTENIPSCTCLRVHIPGKV